MSRRRYDLVTDVKLPPVEFTTTVRALIEVRSQGLCEACGVGGSLQVHHRLYKSRLGRGNAANGLHLCGLGGASGCHGRAHSGHLGETTGWAIRTGGDPLLVPYFRTHTRSWFRLDDDGGSVPMKAVDAVEYMVLIGAVRSGAGWAY